VVGFIVSSYGLLGVREATPELGVLLIEYCRAPQVDTPSPIARLMESLKTTVYDK